MRNTIKQDYFKTFSSSRLNSVIDSNESFMNGNLDTVLCFTVKHEIN